MDKVYHILTKVINIDADRQSYSKIYIKVVKTIEDGLKRNEFFKAIYRFKVLSGSYADNLKITKPNEFDLVMRFEFPEKHAVKIIADEVNKGNVFIDLTDVLTLLSGDVEKMRIYKFLSGLVSDGLLLENKFQSWFQGCMDIVLNQIGKSLTCTEKEYNLEYKRSGPAHTINVYNLSDGKFIFSIDFVPGFVFEGEKSVSVRRLTSKYWEAIPRPLKSDTQTDNASFRTSYTDSERVLILGKYQLKNALRLMKKYRDLRPELQLIKSYYLKTIFLWLDEEVEATFWKKPVFEIMREVFKKLENALTAGEIKFFWDRELNMLANIKSTRLEAMQHTLCRSIKILNNPKSQKAILRLFLSVEEQKLITEEDMQLVADCIEESNIFLVQMPLETCEENGSSRRSSCDEVL